MTVLVTGARGALGRCVTGALRRRGVAVRGSGRGDGPPAAAIDWRRADLTSGEGLDRAMAGVAAVIHCATDPEDPARDVVATDRLIRAAQGTGALIVHVGIAGIEDAAAVSPYYRAKLQCERALAAGGVAHVICRATQFHPFVAHILDRLGRGPVQLCPPMRLQPVDPRFLAERLVDHALEHGRGRTADVHGPDTLDTAALVGPWLRARDRRRLRVPIPALGPLAGFARLRQVVGDSGGAPWRAWLEADA